MLPNIPNRSGAAKLQITRFGGIDRRPGAGNGAVRWMENMTTRDAPVLSSRPGRACEGGDLNSACGICGAGDRLYFAIDSALFYNDAETVIDDDLPDLGLREMLVMGNRLLLWPDKTCYTRDPDTDTHTKSTLGASVTQSCTFADGTYAGESAAGNTIVAADASYDWSTLFRVGDAVTISGAADADNNKTAVVREIAGRYLRFYENSFTVNATARSITVARTVPDLDFLCVCDNRVWGCKGDTVRCCKLGDPTNWNVFDGLSTDSWSVETGTPGDFTGCVSFMGYPIFFKADKIFKVYGSRPSNFELMGSATLGVRRGAHKTLAVAGETLFYLSDAGIVRYNGGYPSVIGQELNVSVDFDLDDDSFRPTAGSDGRRYYLSASLADMETNEVVGSCLLVYDTQTGLWSTEDSRWEYGGFAFADGKLYSAGNGLVIYNANASDFDCWTDCYVEFADFDLQTFGGKYPVRLWLRYELEERYAMVQGVRTDVAALTVTISYNGGAFQSVTTLPAGGKNTKYVPVPIKRCDSFSIKLSANSAWKLYGMELETRAERTSRRSGA